MIKRLTAFALALMLCLGCCTPAALGAERLQIQDLADYARLELQYDSLHVYDDHTLRAFSGKADAIDMLIGYIHMLADTNPDLTMSPVSDKSFNNGRNRFYRVTLIYSGSLNVPNILEADSSLPKGAVSLWFSKDGDSLRGQLSIAWGAEFADLGYRSDGSQIALNTDLDARFRASTLFAELPRLGMNQAVVLRGAQRFTSGEVSFKVSDKKDVDEFRIYNYYRAESIAFTVPHNELLAGDQLDRRVLGVDLSDGFFTTIEDVFSYRYVFKIGVNRERECHWLQDLPKNGFENAELYVVEWDQSAGYAVIYMDLTFRDEPEHIEVLARFALREDPRFVLPEAEAAATEAPAPVPAAVPTPAMQDKPGASAPEEVPSGMMDK